MILTAGSSNDGQHGPFLFKARLSPSWPSLAVMTLLLLGLLPPGCRIWSFSVQPPIRQQHQQHRQQPWKNKPYFVSSSSSSGRTVHYESTQSNSETETETETILGSITAATTTTETKSEEIFTAEAAAAANRIDDETDTQVSTIGSTTTRANERVSRTPISAVLNNNKQKNNNNPQASLRRVLQDKADDDASSRVLSEPRWPPQTPNDLSAKFFQVYQQLEHPGPIFQAVASTASTSVASTSTTTNNSTMLFSYVTPPTSDGQSTWKNPQLLLNNNNEDEDGWKPDANSHKPLALYVPGLDGYGISAQRQFDELAKQFELWRLVFEPTDRSSFRQVTTAICEFLQEKTLLNPNRPVLVIGESCGGVLVTGAVLRLLQAAKNRRDPDNNNNPAVNLTGLVLVNPATSFDQTTWDLLVPVLTSLQYLTLKDNKENDDNDALTPYSVIGSLTLSALIPDGHQRGQILDLIVGLPTLNIPPRNVEQVTAIVTAMTDAFRGTEQRLPPALLQHRVTNWLDVGNSVIQPRLSEITVPTLIVAGADDALVPSKQEAERLVSILPHAEKLIVPGRGHFVLDDNVNLTEAILYSKLDPLNWKQTKKPYDPVTDWKLPSRKEIDEAIEKTVKPLTDVLSPVFFSTDERTGKRWPGLAKYPSSDGPVVIVGNHQFFALDLRIIFAELLQERGIVARGMAHPVLFLQNGVSDLLGRTPGITRPSSGNYNQVPNDDFQKFGALPVTPKNYYRMMQTGQTALLYPGGAKEAFGGDKDYPLYWPQDKADFVRTAARFNATIIPLAAIGMLECVNYIAPPEAIYNVPFLGDWARNASGVIPPARYDRSSQDETFGLPLFTPSLPARNYFVFGKPIRTHDLDPMDKDACAKVYEQVQREVRRGLDDVLTARNSDPFRDAPKRLAYERLLGKKAPTFPISELNT